MPSVMHPNYHKDESYSGHDLEGKSTSGGAIHCFGKIHAIMEKTGLLLTFDEIHNLCLMWASDAKANGQDTWTHEDSASKINTSTKQELEKDIKRAKLRSIMQNYVAAEQKVYA